MSYFPIQYPPNWDEIRKERIELDDYKCQNCGTKNIILHIHHRIPLSKGGPNDLDNLITLCESCHDIEHSTMEDEIRLFELSNMNYISVLKCWTCGRTFSHSTGLAFCSACSTFLQTENVTKSRQRYDYHRYKYGVKDDKENDYNKDDNGFIPEM